MLMPLMFVTNSLCSRLTIQDLLVSMFIALALKIVQQPKLRNRRTIIRVLLSLLTHKALNKFFNTMRRMRNQLK